MLPLHTAFYYAHILMPLMRDEKLNTIFKVIYHFNIKSEVIPQRSVDKAIRTSLGDIWRIRSLFAD